MSLPAARALGGEFLRFSLLRAACSVLSYGLYLLLLLWQPYELAYVVSFVAGVALAYVVNATLVFREPMRGRSALRFPLVYVAQFAIIWVLLRIAVEHAGVPEAIALGLAVLAMLPITFLLSRRVIRGPGPGPASGNSRPEGPAR